jgi:hypothetical protein
VYSFNTVGFFLAFTIIALVYAFWCWAFLPIPAANYTVAVLRGVFGPSAKITQLVGRRFKVLLTGTMWIDMTCRIKERGSGTWFVYRLTSSPISTPDLQDIAMRHGMSAKSNCFSACINSDELHQRSILMARALSLAAQ